GIRDLTVTGVQTCALPILWMKIMPADLGTLPLDQVSRAHNQGDQGPAWRQDEDAQRRHHQQNYSQCCHSTENCTAYIKLHLRMRSEERRVGKECRCEWEEE